MAQDQSSDTLTVPLGDLLKSSETAPDQTTSPMNFAVIQNPDGTYTRIPVDTTPDTTPAPTTPPETTKAAPPAEPKSGTITVSIDQLKKPEPPPPEPTRLEKATGWGPLIGSTVGSVALGGLGSLGAKIGLPTNVNKTASAVGAGIGGAAGEGYQQIYQHWNELGPTLRDIFGNLTTQPGALWQGFKEGATEGAKDVAASALVNAGMDVTGQAVMGGIGAAGTGVYRGLLKPGLAGIAKSDAADIVKAAIKEWIPISQFGVDRANALIKGLYNRVNSVLANSTAPYIDLHDIADGVRQWGLNSKYNEPGYARAPMDAIMKVADTIDQHQTLPTFMGRTMTTVSPSEANVIKRGLQSQVFYGEERSAQNAAVKEGARLMRVAIEQGDPVVGPLNARESKVIDVAKAMKVAIDREANKGFLGGMAGRTLLPGGVGGMTGAAEYYRSGNPTRALGTGLAGAATGAVFELGGRMMLQPAVLSRIAMTAERISRIPGVGPVTAARIAFKVYQSEIQPSQQR